MIPQYVKKNSGNHHRNYYQLSISSCVAVEAIMNACSRKRKRGISRINQFNQLWGQHTQFTRTTEIKYMPSTQRLAVFAWTTFISLYSWVIHVEQWKLPWSGHQQIFKTYHTTMVATNSQTWQTYIKSKIASIMSPGHDK